MDAFSHDRRRKIGVITLALACLLMAGWIRSRVVSDHVTFTPDKIRYQLSSCRGEIRWEHWQIEVPQNRWSERFSWGSGNIDPTEPDHSKWKPLQAWDYQGFSIGLGIWTIAYSSIVIPLTLISAYLLLAPPDDETPADRQPPA